MEMTDEGLVQAHLKGYEQALDLLLGRYIDPLWFYLLKTSRYKGKPYLDDIRQRVLMIIYEGIITGKFTDNRPGSFRRWAYTIAKLECYTMDRKRKSRPMSLSRAFPDKPRGLPDHLLVKKLPDDVDYGRGDVQMRRVLKKLKPQEKKLMKLMAQGKTYKQIKQYKEFKKYSLDYLMLKVYNIRQRMLKEIIM